MNEILENPEIETETEFVSEPSTEPIETEVQKDYSSDLEDIKTLLRDLNKETSVSTESENVDILQELQSLSKEVKSVSIASQNIQTISIPVMCGIGILIGCVCALIFSNFFRG